MSPPESDLYWIVEAMLLVWIHGNWRSVQHWTRLRVFAVAVLFGICLPMYVYPAAAVEAIQNNVDSDKVMHAYYDAAYRLQAAGEMKEADVQHRLFLAAVLHHIANGRANIGQYERAVPLYEEALRLNAEDFSLHLDYAMAAFDAGEEAKAMALSQAAMQLAGNSVTNAGEMETLGRALWAMGDHEKAIEEFKSAAAADPTPENVTTLAQAYLIAGNKESAVKVLDSLIAMYGDKAVVHMEEGRVYAIENDLPDAIVEYKKAIAENPRLADVHYSLGACYMSKGGGAGYPEAEIEFHRELALHPDDIYSYPQLGRIALSRHDDRTAKSYLERAAELNSHDPNTFILLGRLYMEMQDPEKAEAALRKAIAVVPDPSWNHYAIHEAHYQLGRFLMQRGDVAAGNKELHTAEEQLALERSRDDVQLAGKSKIQLPPPVMRRASAAEIAAEQQYERTAGKLIAASYNNLGVHAAMQSEYARAVGYFKWAAKWNPELQGVYKNWGQAAFAAGQYANAVEPLRRSLAVHPGNAELQADLAASLQEIREHSVQIDATQ